MAKKHRHKPKFTRTPRTETPAETVERIKAQEIIRFNFQGTLETKVIGRKPCFQGQMSLEGVQQGLIGYNPEYAETSKSLEAQIDDPFELAITSLIQHELAHRGSQGGGSIQGCPRNIDLHTKNILGPVSEVLKNAGYANTLMVMGGSATNLYHYMSNMIEDIIDNFETALRGKRDPLGAFLFYRDDSDAIKSEASSIKDPIAQAKAAQMSPLFDAFVRLQQHLYGGKRAETLLKPYHCSEPKVDTAIKNINKRLKFDKMERIAVCPYRRANKDITFSDIKTKQEKRVKVKGRIAKFVFDRHKALEYCCDETNWAEISKVIIEEFLPFIDKNKMNDPEYIKETFKPLKGGQDKSPCELDDPEAKMRYVVEVYEEQKGTGEKPGKGAFKPPAWINENMALDFVYQRLARNVDLKTQCATLSTGFVATRYSWREADFEKDNLRRARVFLRPNMELGLKVRNHPFEIPIKYTINPGNIPPIRFILRDNSGSMQWGINGDATGMIMNPWAKPEKQWRNDSRYHFALIGEWSLQELLKRSGTLKHTSYKSVSYSSSTRGAQNFAKAKQDALHPEFGGTTLGVEQIAKMFGSTEKELVFHVGDGDIGNWNHVYKEAVVDKDGKELQPAVTVGQEFIKYAKKHYYFHIQIGPATQATRDMEAAGLMVVYDDGKNIAKYVIDFTKPFIAPQKVKK